MAGDGHIGPKLQGGMGKAAKVPELWQLPRGLEDGIDLGQA